jgi:hypothetical protein
MRSTDWPRLPWTGRTRKGVRTDPGNVTSQVVIAVVRDASAIHEKWVWRGIVERPGSTVGVYVHKYGIEARRRR